MYKIICCLLSILVFSGAQGADCQDNGGIEAEEGKISLSLSSHESFKQFPEQANVWLATFDSYAIQYKLNNQNSSIKEDDFLIMLNRHSPANNNNSLQALVAQLTAIEPSQLGFDILFDGLNAKEGDVKEGGNGDIDKRATILINNDVTRQFVRAWNDTNIRNRDTSTQPRSLDTRTKEEEHERTFREVIAQRLNNHSLRAASIHDFLSRTPQLLLRTEHHKLTTGEAPARVDLLRDFPQPPGGAALHPPPSHDTEGGGTGTTLDPREGDGGKTDSQPRGAVLEWGPRPDLSLERGTPPENDGAKENLTGATGQTGVADDSDGDEEEDGEEGAIESDTQGADDGREEGEQEDGDEESPTGITGITGVTDDPDGEKEKGTYTPDWEKDEDDDDEDDN